MKASHILTLVGILLVAAAGLVLLRSGADDHRLGKLTRDFAKCLPADLTEEQRDEVIDLLAMYEAAAKTENVPGSQLKSINEEIERYAVAGSIGRKELERLMARISTATAQVNIQHPLLEED